MQTALCYFGFVGLCFCVAIGPTHAQSQEEIHIEGQLLMRDDITPHVAAVVQAVTPAANGEGKATVVATTLSDKRGRYQLTHLKPGQYQVRCYTGSGRYVYYTRRQDADGISWSEKEPRSSMSSSSPGDILQLEAGESVDGVDFRIPPFKKGTWRNYTYLDGLAFNYAGTIYRDRDGFLWFGISTEGVSRFDGETFFNLTFREGLGGGGVNAIAQDSDGVMWFGSRYRAGYAFLGGGVSRYTPSDSPLTKGINGGELVNLTAEDGLAGDHVFAIHRDADGVLWFGTDGGVSRYDRKEFVNLTTEDGLAGNAVLAIHRDSKGDLWFGTSAGVSRYDGKEFINFTTEDGLADNAVHDIYGDPNGNIWFATSGGVSYYDEKTFISLTTADGLVDNRVNAIHADPDGVIWFATSGGVSRYDGEGFVNFTAADGLAGYGVRDIYRDPHGLMWFAGHGVSLYDPGTFISLTEKDGFPNRTVYAIHRDGDGSLWFGTRGGGVLRYDDSPLLREEGPGVGFVTFTTEDGLAGNRVYAIHQDADGLLWFGTNGGVSRYNGKTFVNFTTEDGLAHNRVVAIYRDPDGVMWFATRGGGVSRYDGKRFVNFTTEDGLAHNSVGAIHRDADGVMWFATFGGVSRYDGKTFVNFTTKDGLAGNYVLRAIHQDPDGTLWFGTWLGVSRYIPPHSPLVKGGSKGGFVNFTRADGLAGREAEAIHRSADGILWFATWTGGVSGYDGIAWTSLDTRDGLASNLVGTIYEDTDGALWFGTTRGPTRYRRSTTPPGIRIVSVRTDQKYTDLSAIPPIPVSTRVTIEYAAIDFKTLPEKRQYRACIIEGGVNSAELKKDGDYWLSPTKASTFDHTFDAPGAYTFAVQAIDRDLNYSKPATLTLHVK